MNRLARNHFTAIKKSAAEFESEVARIYEVYRQTMSTARHEAQRYKDESAFVEGKQKDAIKRAQTAISQAQNVFTGEIKPEIEGLRDELHRALVTSPTDAFLKSLSVYSDYNLAPSRSEVDALIELAAGNGLALRALNAVLTKTGSAYRVSVPTTEGYEADLKALENLAEGHIVYSSPEFRRELTEILAGSPRMVRRRDGSYYDGGFRYDALSVSLESEAYSQRVAALDDMGDRWTDSVLPTVYDASLYKGSKDPETGETVSPEQQFVNDYQATAKNAAIIGDPDAAEEAIREQTRAAAALDAKAARTLDYYIRPNAAQ